MLLLTYSRRRTLLEFAPLLFHIIAIILIAIGLSGPVPMHSTRVSFMALTPASSTSPNPQGVWLGVRGSCYRATTNGPLSCSNPSFEPNFNASLSVFFDLDNTPILEVLPSRVVQLPAVITTSVVLHAISFIVIVVGQCSAHIRPNDIPLAYVGYYPRTILWLGTALQAIAFFLVLTGSLALQKQMGDFQDAFNDAVKLVSPQPSLNKASAGPVYGLLFSGTALGGISLLGAALSYLAFTPLESDFRRARPANPFSRKR